jgi:hypothetical protein
VAAARATLAAAGASSPADFGLADVQCPPATNERRTVVLNGTRIDAPRTTEQTSDARSRLASEDTAVRRQAIASLALAGDLETFHRLLTDRETAGLSTYASSYVNRDGTACVAGEIEDAILLHLDDPILRPSLLMFLGTNLYRHTELFHGLLEVEFDDRRPDDFPRVVRALTATRLSDIESEILAKAESLLVHDTPVRKRVLPGVHRIFVTFLADRRWEPAIDYMERLLQIEGYREGREYFVAEFSVTRSTVYRALDRFPSPAVANVFVRQLERVVASCPDDLVMYEVAAFGPFAVRHAHTVDQLDRVAASLGALVGAAPDGAPTRQPAPGAADYRIHKACVELLAELGTAEAVSILVRDLARTTTMEERARADAQLVSTLEALRMLPESAELDVADFIEVAQDLPPVYRILTVPEILDPSLDPAAHTYYLSLLRWFREHPDPARVSHAIDAERAVRELSEELLEFEEPAQLAASRDEIDLLFEAGLLDEPSYLAISGDLNQLDGGESAVYQELVARRRLEREAEARARMQAETAPWLQLVDDNLSKEGIQRNLDRLDRRDSGASTAAAWLVMAGDRILPLAHPELVDPAASDELLFALLQVIGEIGHPSSLAPVIQIIRRHSETPTLVKAGLQALALLPASENTRDLADDILEGEYPMVARQQALVYLAAVRDPGAAEVARRYTATGIDPELRVVGLLLAARLGDERVLSDIKTMLPATEDRSLRDVLFRALGELSDPASLAAFTEKNPAVVGAESARRIGNLVGFRHSSGVTKLELAQSLVESGQPWDRQEAVAYLVEHNHGEVLASYLQLSPIRGLPVMATAVHSPTAVSVLAQIRRMGCRVEETPEGIAVVRDG